jgi:hypothetical protein
MGGSGTIIAWAKMQMVQSGTSLTGMITPCGHSVPDRHNEVISESYRITYPSANFARTPAPPATNTSGMLGSTAPGASFTLARSAWMIGVTLPDPVNSAWPTATSIQMVDADGDSHPGISPTYSNGGGFVYPPVNLFRSARAERVYLAARITFSLGGTMTSCTQLSGSASMQDAEYRLVGCRISGNSRNCDSDEADALDSNTPDFQPGSASYTMLKIADSGTCADVRAAVP